MVERVAGWRYGEFSEAKESEQRMGSALRDPLAVARAGGTRPRMAQEAVGGWQGRMVSGSTWVCGVWQ